MMYVFYNENTANQTKAFLVYCTASDSSQGLRRKEKNLLSDNFPGIFLGLSAIGTLGNC